MKEDVNKDMEVLKNKRIKKKNHGKKKFCKSK
jgi:hypothetical protein